MHIIYITGIDGAGKSTLARSLAAALEAKYLYLGAEAGLLRTIRRLIRKFSSKMIDAPVNSQRFVRKQSELLTKFPHVYRFYFWLQYVHLVCLSWWKFALAASYNLVVVDRYYFDMVVSRSCTFNYLSEQTLKVIHKLEVLLPVPDIALFLDVDEKSAFDRKSDIANVKYLTDRKVKYEQLCDIYQWHTIDANRSRDDVFRDALSLIKRGTRMLLQEQSASRGLS